MGTGGSVTHVSDGNVIGFLHRPDTPDGRGMVLTHSASANCRAPLLFAAGKAFADMGITVLRCDMIFRQQIPSGPPLPGTAAEGRAGLRDAANWMRKIVSGPIVLGGHSWGGRQSSMLAAEQPDIAEVLLLLAYPLHPPHKPERLRTAHFPNLRTPSIFVHGDVDTYATAAELDLAISAIPARTTVLHVSGADHRLPWRLVNFAEIGEAVKTQLTGN